MARSSNAVFAICAFAIWLAAPPPSLAADGANKQEIDAQEIVNHCWDISSALRSGSTNSMYLGFVETIICFKTKVVELAAPMFDPDIMSPARIEWLLTEMAHPYGEFFERLHNDHKKCYCGTLVANSRLWGIAELYEQVLRDVVAQRNAHPLQ